MPITIIVTAAGRAALVNAENTGTDPVTIAEIGFSPTAVAPTPAATTLPGEIKRIAGIGGLVVANDTIHVVATDVSADAYSLRSIALYLADGTLFAIYGQPDPILVKTATSFGALAIDVVFADIDATSLTFGDADFLMPPASTERQGVVELATVAEAQAGIDALRALAPASAKAAVLGWLLSQDGAGSGLDADLLRGKHWTSGQDVSLGQIIARTPNAGPGLQLRAKAAPGGAALVQITDAAGTTELGTFSIGTDGRWHFSGELTGATLALDLANAYIAAHPSGMVINWDANDFAIFNRTRNALEMYIASQLQFDVRPDGWVFARSGFTVGPALSVWHAGNDGSGSGLDADLLDGRHASDFILNSDVSTFGANEHGYWERRANGVIEQWGRADGLMSQGSFGDNFPIAYGDVASIHVEIITINAGAGTGTSSDVWAQIQSINAAGFYGVIQASTTGGFCDGYMWRAVGR
jgi:hypothetical protein